MKDLDVSVIHVNNDLAVKKEPPKQQPRRKKLPQFTAAFLANLITIAFGNVNAWTSPSLLLLRDPETAIGGRPITLEEESWISSITFIGALIMVPVYSKINQDFGRKITGYLTAIPFIIGWCFIIFADSVIYILVGRFFTGVGISGVNVFVTMYCGEIAEDNVRGVLGLFRAIFSTLGIISMYAIGSFVSIQTMAIIVVSVPLLFLVGMFFLPESPMYLMTKGKEQEAMKSLLWLCGGNEEAAKQDMEKLVIVIRDFTSKTSKKVTLKDMLSFRGTRRAIVIAFFLAVIQQFSGMYVVFSFCASIFEMAGTDMSPHTSSLIVGFVLLAGCLIASFIIDIAGRRIILLVTQVTLFLTHGGLGVYFYLKDTDFDISVLGVLPIICLSIDCLCLAIGIPSLAYVVVAEIFSPEARGLATLTLNAVVWFLAFLITKFYPILLTIIQAYGCFWLFACVAIIGAIYIYFELPETKNRSLESILRELNGETEQKKPNLLHINIKSNYDMSSPNISTIPSGERYYDKLGTT